MWFGVNESYPLHKAVACDGRHPGNLALKLLSTGSRIAEIVFLQLNLNLIALKGFHFNSLSDKQTKKKHE